MVKRGSRDIAREVISKFPDEKVYTCASGISHLGVVHARNFKDIITSGEGYSSLIELRKPARLLSSWDEKIGID